MSKHYRYQILVKVPGGKETLTDIVFSSLRHTMSWISNNEMYEGQYTYQKFYGSIPDRVLGEETEPVDPEPDPLAPSATLLIKLGSIAVHAEELLSPTGHEFDKAALDGLLNDPEVQEWREEMDKMAFLPVKRNR